jgi:hypothetical protein
MISGSNSGRRGAKPASNLLSYSTAIHNCLPITRLALKSKQTHSLC